MSDRIFKLAFCAGLLLFCSPLFALAQSAKPSGQIGRLPDGRAYRIDSAGYRLVDHLAELEVTNSDLLRQVRSLEDELEDKERAIENLKKGLPAAGRELKEDSLLGPASSKVSKSVETPNCNELVSGLYVKLAQLEKQQQTQGFAPAVVPASSAKCDYDSAENPWKEQAMRAQQLLSRAPNKEELANGAKRIKELQDKLAETQAAMGTDNGKSLRVSEELSVAKQQVSLLEKNVAQLQLQLASKERELKQLEENEEIQAKQASSTAKTLSQLQEQLAAKEQESRRLAQSEDARAKEVSSVSKSVAKLQEQLEEKDQELKRLSKSETGARAELALATANAAAMQERLDAREKEFEQLAKREALSQSKALQEASNALKLQEMLEAKEEEAKQLSKRQAAEAKRAVLAAPQESVREEELKKEPSARREILKGSSGYPVQGMDSMIISEAKKELQQNLNKIHEQIIKRKDLMDQLKKRGQAVSVQMQPLVARDGSSLDRLRQEIISLNQSSELGRIRSALKQIEQILADDISVLQRLNRL